MHVILLCGFKRCGKDTFANYISQCYNYTHLKISQKLKKTLQILFDFNHEQIEGDEKDTLDKQWDITPRQVMQFVGTEIFQHQIQKLIPNINRDFWIKSISNEIESIYKESPNQNIVISDLRFIHEINYLSNLSRTYNNNIHLSIVKILRPELIITHDSRFHESESQHLQFKFDKIIQNTNMKEYIDRIDQLMNSFERK